MAKNINSRYSDPTVTPAQRGHFTPQWQDSSWAATWHDNPVPSVENAHDQQAAPTHLHEAPLNNNAYGSGAKPPVVDRASQENFAK